MKAAIYNPYWETLGGGERYVASFVKVLLENGWEVHIQSDNSNLLTKLDDRLKINIRSAVLVEDIKRGDGYDLCFWLSDGSIPTLRSRKNILHFQRPFYDVDGRSLINRMKLFRIKTIVVNSAFTKSWIDKEYSVRSRVIYPPVDVYKFKPGRKENSILYVGRFSQLEQSKRQDVLVDAFIRLRESGVSDWRLVLAGGSDVGRTGFVDELVKKSADYPIEIVENPPFVALLKLYARAKLFWSASGYGENETENPHKVEHFGISVVEAMAAKCVPLVYNAGGHKEIVSNSINGYLFGSVDQLLSTSKKLIENKKELKHIADEAYGSSKKYSYERFKEEVLQIV